LLRSAVPVALTSFHSTEHLKIKGIGSALPSKLRFENKTAVKMLKQAWTFLLLFYLFVTAEGFEPPTLRAEI
jgi:hypothetical protein